MKNLKCAVAVTTRQHRHFIPFCVVLLVVFFFVLLYFEWGWESINYQDIAPINYCSSSVTMQKGESQNWCYKKTKHAKVSEKRIFLTPDMLKCSFFGKFGRLCFLITPILKFVFSPYYQQIILM